jgi:RNA polymerase sigma-70 factor (ECF subfamily)
MSQPELDTSHWFNSEIKPHESALRGYLYHHVPELVDVDDVVQETYRRILDVRKKKTIEHPRGLLFTIARNAATDLFRKRKSSRTISITEIDTVPVIDSTDNPDEALGRSDEVALLNQAILALPKRCRQIFILRKLENLSHREISERLGISVHTVESQLTKGLKKCQKYFERKGLI